MPFIATCDLKSVSPYSQSRHVTSEKGERETPEEYEKRTWRQRCHTTKDGDVFIPAAQFSNSLKNAAKYLSIKIKGQGQAKYTAKFKAGTMVIDDLILPMNADDVVGVWKFVPSDGTSGGSKRVDRCFPEIPEWSGQVKYYVLDDIITQEVFERVLRASGSLVGIGMYRPQNGGVFGRFSVENVQWDEYSI